MRRNIMIYKRALALILIGTCLATGCSKDSDVQKQTDKTSPSTESGERWEKDSDKDSQSENEVDNPDDAVGVGEKFDVAVEFSNKQLDSDYTKETQCEIHLSDSEIKIEGTGMVQENHKVTITQPGTYVIDGNCSDGQIWVETQQDGYVWLVLNNVTLTCITGPAIYVENAENTKITLPQGTKNVIADGSDYDAESQAAIFSRDDLVLNGSGSLTVMGNKNHGIQSKDDLRIVEGTITLNTVGDGIVGKDSVELKAPVLNILSGGDGIKSTNTEEHRGYVYMENPTVNIEAEKDGIQAETCLKIIDGTYQLSTGGGSEKASMKENGEKNPGWGTWGEGGMAPNDEVSAKGLKAGVDITISGGDFHLDTSDDSIHSNGSLYVQGGTYSILSGDDGMHSDATLEITGGTIDIQKSYEGIESGEIIIRDGDITCTASDDGLNVAGGRDASSMNGRPGQNLFAADSRCKLIIYGGTMYLNASGDGLDSNGSIEINGGTIYVDGPTNGGNGSLDYGTECNVNGGELMLTGSIGMAEAPTGGSQNSFLVATDCDAKSIITIKDSKGTELITYTPAKACQTVLYSSKELQQGETYSILVDGRVATTVTLEGTVSSTVTGGMHGGMGIHGGMDMHGGMGGRNPRN